MEAIAAGQPAATLGPLDDEMSAIYASLSTVEENEMALGTSRVDENEAASKEERAKQQDALKQAEANEAKSGSGFFASIGHLVSDVATDVVHGRFDSAINDAGRDLRDAWNSPQFWHDLETGLEGVAIVAAAVATAGVGGVVVMAAATTVGVVAGTGAGLAEARTEHFAGAAEDANASATEAQNRIDQLQEFTNDVIESVEQDEQALGGAQQSLTGAIQTDDQTRIAEASTKKG